METIRSFLGQTIQSSHSHCPGQTRHDNTTHTPNYCTTIGTTRQFTVLQMDIRCSTMAIDIPKLSQQHESQQHESQQQ